MKDKVCERLLSIKSIVTLVLTIVFAVLSLMQCISAEQFITIFTVIISFYFGTQAVKHGVNSKE